MNFIKLAIKGIYYITVEKASILKCLGLLIFSAIGFILMIKIYKNFGILSLSAVIVPVFYLSFMGTLFESYQDKQEVIQEVEYSLGKEICKYFKKELLEVVTEIEDTKDSISIVKQELSKKKDKELLKEFKAHRERLKNLKKYSRLSDYPDEIKKYSKFRKLKRKDLKKDNIDFVINNEKIRFGGSDDVD